MPIFQHMPKPAPNVVDRSARDRAALLLRRFANGQITNDDFDNDMPITSDPAIAAIWGTVWLVYSDSRSHHLNGGDRLHPDEKRIWMRWLIFLDSDHPYIWPEVCHPGADPVTKYEAKSRTLIGRLFTTFSYEEKIKAFKAAGNYAVWPFVSQSDYRTALRNPRRLNARKPA